MVSSAYSESSILTGDTAAMIFSWGAYSAKIFYFEQLPALGNRVRCLRLGNIKEFRENRGQKD